jgi:hypothetical protein
VQLAGANSIPAAERAARAKIRPISRRTRTFGVVRNVLTTTELRRRQLKNAIKS